jgi:hypothetical protein
MKAIILCYFIAISLADFQDTQRDALTTLHQTTNQNNTWHLGALNGNKTNWLSGHFCHWKGVTCYDKNVVAIDLSNCGLSGNLTDAISELTELEFLDLSDNDLYGYIPESFYNLKHLKTFIFANTQLLEVGAPVGSNFAPIGNNFGMIVKAKNVGGSVYNNDNDNNNNNDNNFNPTLNINGSGNTIVYNVIFVNNNMNSNKNMNN